MVDFSPPAPEQNYQLWEFGKPQAQALGCLLLAPTKQSTTLLPIYQPARRRIFNNINFHRKCSLYVVCTGTLDVYSTWYACIVACRVCRVCPFLATSRA